MRALPHPALTRPTPLLRPPPGDGQVLGTSERYTTRAARDKGIEAVKRCAPEAEIREVAESAGYPGGDQCTKLAPAFTRSSRCTPASPT